MRALRIVAVAGVVVAALLAVFFVSPAGHALVYFFHGKHAQRQGDIAAAEGDYDRAIAIDPLPLFRAYRGQLRLRGKNYAGALDDLNAAITSGLKQASLFQNRAMAEWELRRTDEARHDVARALELNPRDAWALSLRAQISWNSGDVQGALADSDQAVTLQPDHPAFRTARGNLRLSEGDLDGAFSDYDFVLSHAHPALFSSYMKRGLVEDLQGRPDDAMRDFFQACQLSPPDNSYAHLYLWIAETRRDKGNPQAADAHLRVSLESLHSSTAWTRQIAEFLLGQTPQSDFLKAAPLLDALPYQNHACEAFYYAGIKALLTSDRPAADDLFRRCLATGATNYYEYWLSSAELKQLPASP